MIDWNSLYKISLGLYVLGAKEDDKLAGSIIDAVMVAANKPTAVAISCNNMSFTGKMIKRTNEFSLSVLPFDVDPFVIANFGFQSSKNIDKWQNVSYLNFNEMPVLTDAVAHITAKVMHQFEMDSNTLFVAEVTDTNLVNNKKELLYEDYRQKLKDDVIKSFQQYIKEKNNG